MLRATAMLGLTGCLIGAGVGAAQTPAAAPSAQNASQTMAQTSQSLAITDRYLTTVPTELVSRVDTKNAAVGQEVALRTRQNATLADGTVLPRGTRLVGHIIHSEPQNKSVGTGALLAINFDRAELKGGQTVSLRSVIRMVAPAVPAGVAQGPASMSPVESMGGLPTSTTRSGSTIGASRTGNMGTGGRTASDPTGQATGSLGSGIDDTTGQPAAPIGQGTGRVGQGDPGIGSSRTNPGNGAGSVAANANRPVANAGESVRTGPRSTQLPGVMLNPADTAATSGTLFTLDRNISLESGTQITLGVITR